MKLGIVLSLFIFYTVSIEASRTFEPAVAFVCGKGSMHMEHSGKWVSDSATDCIESKAEILKYCQKNYPTLDVTNIVESTKHVHIRGWCPLNKDCDQKQAEAFKVQYYRCLTGPFQSAALEVQHGCHFYHIHDDKDCQSFDHWKDEARQDCKSKNMNVDNFAMLLPCGTDVFTGVEYVCCASEQAVTTDANPMDTTQTTNKVEVAPIISVKTETKKETKERKLKESVSEDDTLIKSYFDMDSTAYATNEHNAFKAAKKQLLKISHDKTTKLLKDWSSDKKKVEDLKATDPKEAEKLNKEISSKYQKEYFAVQADADSRIVQLDSTHQQHIQTNLNMKKRKAAEKLMEQLQSKTPDAHEVTKYLKRYISIESKDAQHCVKHYVKIRDRDEEAARSMLATTIEHLSLIDKRIDQSIGLLTTLNDDKTEEDVEDDVRKWMSQNHIDIQATINKLKSTEITQVVKSGKETTTLAVPSKDDEKAPEITITIEHDDELDTPNNAEPVLYKKFADKLAETDFVKKPLGKGDKFVVVKDQKSLNVDEAVVKKEELPSVQLNHMAQGEQLSVESNSLSGSSAVYASANLSVGTILAIALGVIGGLFVVVVVAIVIRNRAGNTQRPPSNNYLEVAVNENMTAEERHVASMQSGYENPTYKFLEKKVIAEA